MYEENTIERLPASWQRKIKRLRKDAANYRVKLRALEAELATLRAELEARSK